MALDTPSHRQRRDLPNYFHRLNLAVTGLAGDTSGKMPLMIEPSELRQLMNAHPLDRLFFIPGSLQFLQLRRLLLDGVVASHAPLHGRHAGNGRAARSVMTEQTIDLQIAGVEFVTMGNRLLWRVPAWSLKVESSSSHQYRGNSDQSKRHLPLSHNNLIMLRVGGYLPGR